MLLQAGRSHFSPWGDYEGISRHMREKMVIGNIKNGLTKGKPYLTSLIVLYDEKFSSGNKRKAVDVVYLDISKAFDLVSYSILVDNWGGMK